VSLLLLPLLPLLPLLLCGRSGREREYHDVSLLLLQYCRCC
jgi:hypothetical protein